MGLPSGITLSGVLSVLIPVALVTIFLRAIPFRVRGQMGDSQLFLFLGNMMPVGVMTILVVYTLSTAAEVPGGFFPGLVATVVTVVTHLWSRKSAVSIVVGTVTYMVLVNAVF